MTGNQWLTSWATNMRQNTEYTRKKPKPQLSENPMTNLLVEGGQVPMKPLIAQESLLQLQKLYGTQNKNNPRETQDNVGTLPGRTMASHILLAQQLQAKREKEKFTADLKDIELD